MTCRNPVLLANDVLRLSDGTTTIDFHSAKIKVLSSYIQLPPPQLENRFIASSFVNGNRLASSRYGNRVITINFLLTGQDQDDLQDSIRSIHRLLNDNTNRVLLGFGSQVYLEYQWGLEPGESVFFDVLSGEVRLPNDFARIMMWQSNTILNVTLELTCEPFGRYANQEIAEASIDNSQSEYDVIISQLLDDTDNLVNAVADIEGQTFTPAVNRTITHIGFKGARLGQAELPGVVTVNVYATAAGVPVGGVLATGTADSNQLGFQAAVDDFLVVELAVPLAITAATLYAFTLTFAGAGVANRINIRSESTNPYAGGTRIWSATGGAPWNIDAGDDLAFLVLIAEDQDNWQDITTVAADGDVPARLYQQLTQVASAGTKKLWIAKRTGTRQEDDLWQEGEDYNSFTDIVGAPHFVGNYITYAADESSDQAARCHIWPSGAIAADTVLARFDWLINAADLPAGQFRLLAKCKMKDENDAADFDHIEFGLGWSYGDRTKTPSKAADEYYAVAANDTFEVLDLGLINIPPIPQSDIAGDNDLYIRIFLYAADTLTNGDNYKCDIAFLFLLPIDEGVVIIDDVAAADLIGMDGLTDRENLYILSAAGVIEDIGDIEGAPFSLGRESTRIYVLRDDDKDMSFLSDITYQPQFLVV